MSGHEQRVRAILAQYDEGASAAWMLCDRHPADAIALTIVDPDLTATDVSFGQLRERSERFAGALARLGIEPGDRVASLMGKSADLVTVMLGVWRLGAVYVPLFTAFGPQAIASRLDDTDTTLVVVDESQLAKLAPGPDMPEDPSWRIVVAGDADAAGGHPTLAQLLDGDPPSEPSWVGGGDGPIVHMLTSGTTGKPKGVIHPLRYVAGWEVYLEDGLGVVPDESFWCAADPGWAYGLYAAVIGPLCLGLRSHLLTGGFSVPATWGMLSQQRITNIAAAPTVYRALRAADHDVPTDLVLRRASSAGEPLTPEVNEWAESVLGVTVRDHFGQTELGMVIGNHHHPDLRRPIKAGSMGRALPGWSVDVLSDDADEPAPANELGRIAIDVHASPLMTFRGYGRDADPGDKVTPDGRWYVTGDSARRDEEGDFHFSARSDDVIIMAGYRIGPFDVESVILQHPAIAECAVIAVPDDVRGEVIEAVVVVRAPHEPGDALVAELQQLVKERYAAYAYPRSVRFVDALPKTPSGKIQRFLLRDELPDPAG